MAVLDVIAPGLHTTVQDLGRIGFQDVGLPGSGPLDRLSFRIANALVGNAADTPALEILLQGPTLKVGAESVRVALAGAAAEIEVRSGTPRRIPSGQSVTLARDDVFRVGVLSDSVCAYLAIEGGPDVAPVLGSAATYPRGGIGGLNGRRFQREDVLPLRRVAATVRAERELGKAIDLALEQPIRVILGPQADYFTDEALRTFLSSEYTVTPQSDRMGFRLEGPALRHAKGYNIVSDGIVSGSVQVPGSGKPIVLMVDNQTTGGYPKIATVISADVPILGRRKPGRAIRFTAVEVEVAEQVRRAQEAAIELACGAIRDMP